MFIHASTSYGSLVFQSLGAILRLRPNLDLSLLDYWLHLFVSSATWTFLSSRTVHGFGSTNLDPGIFTSSIQFIFFFRLLTLPLFFVACIDAVLSCIIGGTTAHCMLRMNVFSTIRKETLLRSKVKEYSVYGISCDHEGPNTLPTLFFTAPVRICPPIPPIPRPQLPPATLFAHFCFASRSAYVKPITLVKLNTSARMTIGIKENPSFNSDTISNAIQSAGNT